MRFQILKSSVPRHKRKGICLHSSPPFRSTHCLHNQKTSRIQISFSCSKKSFRRPQRYLKYFFFLTFSFLQRSSRPNVTTKRNHKIPLRNPRNTSNFARTNRSSSFFRTCSYFISAAISDNSKAL